MEEDNPNRVVRLISAIIGAGLLLLTVWLILTSPHAVAANIKPVIDPALQTVLEKTAPDDLLDVIVYVNEGESKPISDLPNDRIARRIAVAESLLESGTLALQGVTDQLEAKKGQGIVSAFRLLWIINAAQVRGNSKAIVELGMHPDVRLITLDQKIQLVKPQEISIVTSPISLTWGLDRIRAAHAWNGLGINGEGVTVAIMDTGVDWNHPALLDNYRGNSAETSLNHQGNWFDAVDASLAPIDPNGHGTHVAGTAVGAFGIGVAPGAKWIGVRILDDKGFGSIGDVHAGFQWLLAPGGDPSKSPDLVNNSWSGGIQMVDFIPDVAALQLAGIVPIFAAGNDGPFPRSIGAPAAYHNTIAVGASDDEDLVAWFSGRGPSPYTAVQKPTLVAPGTNVLSALPNGEYGYANGTSMATPHIVGVYALLLSTRPELTESEATAVLTSTTVTIENDAPNPGGGWGRVDAFAALSKIAEDSGIVSGTVLQGDNPVPGASILITPGGGQGLRFQSLESGSFSANLSPAIYELKIEKFNYATYYAEELPLAAGGELVISANLEKLPGGRLYGQLLDSTTQSPISGTVRVPGTPILETIGDSGKFTISLPSGSYEVIASAVGYQNDHKQVTMSTNDLEIDFSLDSAPRVLLIDSGNWYYHNQLDFITTALSNLDIGFSIWRVRNPYSDVPAGEDFTGFDVVVWSAPLDSPGYIGAGKALAGYLSGGGNLLITGQNIAWYDDDTFGPEEWWYSQLKGEYVTDVNLPQSVTGEAGTLFESLNLALNGPDSADNQFSIESSRPRQSSFTEVAFRYNDGSPAALQANQCEPFRIIYLGFGLEGIQGAANREEIISRSLEYFTAPDTEAGAHLSPDSVESLVPRGSEAQIEVELKNLSEIFTDTFQLTLANDEWPIVLETDSLTLGPCTTGITTLSVMVAADLPADSFDEFELIATSSNSPDFQDVLQVRLKTPGKILVVDDGRFYDLAEHYRGILDEIGYQFDLWDTSFPPEGNGSPPGKLLNQYDFIIWYTAYDWFQPLTNGESQTLYDYLDQGGRLFLSSQDYLYYHIDDPLTTEFLGVKDYLESVEPKIVYGNLPLGMPVGPLALDYGAYHNYSDGLVPSASANIFAWHDSGGAAVVANKGEDWRALFWGLPFEKIPQGIQPEAMRQSLGWLSNFGDSTFESESRINWPQLEEESYQTYTLTIRNMSGYTGSRAIVTNTLPELLTIDIDSITGGATYDPASSSLKWAGDVDSGGSWTVTYRAILDPNLPPGTRIDNQVSILDTEHDLSFIRTVPIWVSEADLGHSSIVISPSIVIPGSQGILQADLQNDGVRTATVSATVHLAVGLVPLTTTLSANLGTAMMKEGYVSWELVLAPHETAQLTLVISATSEVRQRWLPTTMIIQDGLTDPIIRETILEIRPYQILFPVVFTPQNPNQRPLGAEVLRPRSGHSPEALAEFLSGLHLEQALQNPGRTDPG